MTRPRRSKQGLSIRAFARVLDRSAHRATTSYHAQGRTLVSMWMGGVADRARALRLQRAEAAHALAVADFDEADCADAAVWCDATPHTVRTIASVAAHHAACVARLDAAEAELTAARRSASRPVGELVTPPLVSLPQPRTWPNALPGGTSPRRATRALLRLADSEHVDIVQMPGDPSAYTARMVDIRARAKTVQFGLEYPTRA